jgi:DNA-binding CsgD family transcriptional regulator
MIYNLSPREKQVLELLLQGKSNKQIALLLGIAERTVEFHLHHIYAKFEVGSKIDLILKLGKLTGGFDMILRESTVGRSKEKDENRDRPALWMGRAASIKGAFSIIGKELEMKNILNTKYALIGAVTAVLTGLFWVALMHSFMHMALEEIMPWMIPSLLVWSLLGLIIGLIGWRVGRSPLKVALSAMVGTGLSPLTILPLMGFIVLPLAKLAEWLGLANRDTISNDTATAIAIILMLVIWFMVGVLIGGVLLFVSLQKPRKISQLSEQGL